MYKSQRILSPDSHSELSEVELMNQYGRYFGLEHWVTFSGCPSITLTRVGSKALRLRQW